MEENIDDFNSGHDESKSLIEEIELTGTQDLPNELQVNASVILKMRDHEPNFICVGNSDSSLNYDPTFLHFIYKDKKSADAAAAFLFKEKLIYVPGSNNDVHSSSARAVNVHTKAPNASQEYINREFAFFRVSIEDFKQVFGVDDSAVDILTNRSKFISLLADYEQEQAEYDSDELIDKPKGCTIC